MNLDMTTLQFVYITKKKHETVHGQATRCWVSCKSLAHAFSLSPPNVWENHRNEKNGSMHWPSGKWCFQSSSILQALQTLWISRRWYKRKSILICTWRFRQCLPNLFWTCLNVRQTQNTHLNKDKDKAFGVVPLPNFARRCMNNSWTRQTPKQRAIHGSFFTINQPMVSLTKG